MEKNKNYEKFRRDLRKSFDKMCIKSQNKATLTHNNNSFLTPNKLIKPNNCVKNSENIQTKNNYILEHSNRNKSNISNINFDKNKINNINSKFVKLKLKYNKLKSEISNYKLYHNIGNIRSKLLLDFYYSIDYTIKLELNKKIFNLTETIAELQKDNNLQSTFKKNINEEKSNILESFLTENINDKYISNNNVNKYQEIRNKFLKTKKLNDNDVINLLNDMIPCNKLNKYLIKRLLNCNDSYNNNITESDCAYLSYLNKKELLEKVIILNRKNKLFVDTIIEENKIINLFNKNLPNIENILNSKEYSDENFLLLSILKQEIQKLKHINNKNCKYLTNLLKNN